MKEKEGNRKYKIELGISMVLYMLALFVSLYYAKPMEPGTARTLLLLAPTIPMAMAVWAIARHVARMDEYLRLRALEGLALAAAVTAALSVSYGFLESAGFPKVTMFWVWPVMASVWGVHACLRCLIPR